MAKKIFVSYKYGDRNVKALDNDYWGTTARKYVDKLEDIIGRNDIYKGENDGDDMSTLQDDSIWTNLKQKIFDSSITVVLISPNMKESYRSENNQWIPHEISYSLKEIGHAGRTSRTNGLICVVLPDSYGDYSYYIGRDYLGNEYYNEYVTFDIIKNNQNNKKYGTGSYAITVKWDEFIRNYRRYIDLAIEKQENIDEYNISKLI